MAMSGSRRGAPAVLFCPEGCVWGGVLHGALQVGEGGRHRRRAPVGTGQQKGGESPQLLSSLQIYIQVFF